MSLNKDSIATNLYDGPRRSLVLAGGGVRLAYQAGVLQALRQAGLQFNHVDGTSGGIFNTGMLASGLSPDEMADRWRSLKIKYFMSSLPFKSYFRPFRLTGMGDADGIRQGVFPSLGIDVTKIQNNVDFQATFNVCNFSEKTIESIPGKFVTEDILIAGVSLPIFMPSIWIHNAWYSDAVWIKDANLMEAARQGAQEIWLVWAIGNSKAYLPGSFNQYVHMIEMSANGGLFEEFQQLKALNERIRQGDSPYGQISPIRLHIIKPQFPLPLDPDLFLNKISTSDLINMGYSDALEYLKYSLDTQNGRLVYAEETHKEKPPANYPPPAHGTGLSGNIYPYYDFKGIPYDTSATKMNEPGTCLNFRMLFKGILKMNGEKSPVLFRLAFKLRNFDNTTSLYANAGISFKSSGREISTYNNRAEIKINQKANVILVDSDFRNDGLFYHVKCEIPVHSFPDWRLGLEFKKARLQVMEVHDTIQVIGEGILTQKIRDRLRFLILANLYNPEGLHKKQLKHKMMKWFYRTV